MAATYYASVPTNVRTMANITSGTSTTATDLIELRMGDGTTIPSRQTCIMALELFRRWITQGGLNGAGTNLPPPAHSSG